MHACMHVSMHVSIYLSIYLSIYMQMYMYICIHTCIHIHIYSYIHDRYSQLMRRQEELMVEMERAIFKRDSISVRGKLQQKAKGAPTGAGTKGVCLVCG